MSSGGYARLSKHKGTWRVDGFSHFVHSKHPGTRIKVHFSLVQPEESGQAFRKDALLKDEAGEAKSLELKVHVARLRHFRMGTVWRDGKCVGIPNEYRQFRIQPDQIRFVNFDNQFQHDGISADAILPPGYFQMARASRAGLYNALYAIVPVLNDELTRWLVLPAAELFAFYFGASDRMLTWILCGQYRDKVRGEFHESGKVLELHTDESLSLRERTAFGRSYASEAGFKALHTPHNYLTWVRNANSGGQELSTLVIKALFPFEGETFLTVAGKPYKLGARDNSVWAFGGMRILRCTKGPGFQLLRVVSGVPAKDGEEAAGGGGGQTSPMFDPKIEEDQQNRDELMYDLPADPRLKRLRREAFENPFPNFRDFDTEFVRPRAPGHHARGYHEDVDVEGLTHGEGEGSGLGSGLLGTDFFQSDLPEARQLESFFNVVELLRPTLLQRNWQVRYRTGLHAPPGGRAAIFPATGKKSRSWQMVTNPETKVSEPRQLVFAEIHDEEENQFFYLLEMQLRPEEPPNQCTILAAMNDFRRMKEEVFDELLNLTSIRKRWPSEKTKWEKPEDERRARILLRTLRLSRLNHPARLILSPGEAQEELARRHRVYEKDWAAIILEHIEQSIGTDSETGQFVALSHLTY